jgi:hypothetical protein
MKVVCKLSADTRVAEGGLVDVEHVYVVRAERHGDVAALAGSVDDVEMRLCGCCGLVEAHAIADVVPCLGGFREFAFG